MKTCSRVISPQIAMVCTLIFFVLFGCGGGAAVQTQGNSVPVSLRDGSQDEIYYEGVVEVDSKLKKNDLFQKTKQWIAQNYTASAFYNPLQMEDKGNGIIIARIYFKYTTYFFIHQANYTVYCVGKIQVKDGRYKYTFSDFTYVCSSSNIHYEVTEPKSCANFIFQHNQRNPSSGSYTKALHGLDEGMKRIIASLYQSLSQRDDF